MKDGYNGDTMMNIQEIKRKGYEMAMATVAFWRENNIRFTKTKWKSLGYKVKPDAKGKVKEYITPRPHLTKYTKIYSVDEVDYVR